MRVKLDLEYRSAIERYRALLGHYPVRFEIAPGTWVEAGRGSFDAAYRIIGARREQGLVARIGQWCEFADAPLLATGNHHNDQAVNVVFGSVPMFLKKIQQTSAVELMPEKRGPTIVGDNVTISIGARVFPGLEIGTGSVIGAGAIVRSDVEPFSICGGVPAKVLRYRFDAAAQEEVQRIRWWDFETSYIYENIERLVALACEGAQPRYQRTQPAFALRYHALSGGDSSISVIGIVRNDVVTPIKEAPSPVHEYVAQLDQLGPLEWEADVWRGIEY